MKGLLGVLLLTLGAGLLTSWLAFYLFLAAKDREKYQPGLRSVFRPFPIPLSGKEVFVLFVLGFSGVALIITGFAMLT